MKELEHFIEEPLSDFIETLDDVAQLDQQFKQHDTFFDQPLDNMSDA